MMKALRVRRVDPAPAMWAFVASALLLMACHFALSAVGALV